MKMVRYFIMVLMISDGYGVSLMAQWSSDKSVNNPICTAINNQRKPEMVSDGKGGAIITWDDERFVQSNFEIFAQRIDKDGFTKWTADGVIISAAAGLQTSPVITPDGSGGAIIVWKDTRNNDNDIYAQRVDSTGKVLWAQDGVVVFSGTKEQTDPQICSDGNNGVFVVWSDQTAGVTDGHIYAQRLDASGNRIWGSAGIEVCSTDIYQSLPNLTTDGAGGIIIAWQDWRVSNFDIYAQRVTAFGTTMWAQNGVPVAAGDYNQLAPKLAPDGSNGAYIVFSDYSNGSNPFINVFRIGSNGSSIWSRRVANTSARQAEPSLVNLASGDLILTWEDSRTGNQTDIYAQFFDVGGNPKWGTDGLGICTDANEQITPHATGDGNGGAIIVWEDKRGGSLLTDLYAQKVNVSGVTQWAANGLAVCTAPKNQSLPSIVSDGNHGAVFSWEDYRASFSNSQIYAYRVFSDGTFPTSPAILNVSSKQVSLGTVAKGTSSTKTVNLKNTGGLPITLGTIRSGDPQFSLTPAKTTIAPDETVIGTIRFTPTVLGRSETDISIESNSILGPDSIHVIGIGAGAPAVQVDVSSLDFGSVKLGLRKDKTVKITNSGDDVLNITGVTSTHPAFSSTTNTKTLAIGESFDATIRFSPNSLGQNKGFILIASNAPSSPDTIAVVGSGYGDVDIVISPDNLSFGNVVMGTFKDTTVSITNNGNDTLRVTDLTSNNSDFSASTTTFVVVPGKMYNLAIRFTPSVTGPTNGSYTMISNSTTNPDIINVLGFGVEGPGISVTPMPFSFGEIGVGMKKTLVLKIANTGALKLVVTDITSDNPDYTVQTTQFEVIGGSFFEDSVSFIPSVIGDRSATLTIVSNAVASPTSVPVSGSGKDPNTIAPLRVFGESFTLFQNYPNPLGYSVTSTSMSTFIPYELKRSVHVRLTIFNSLGQSIQILVDEMQNPGRYQVQWDASDLPSGTYFFVMKSGDESGFGSMLLRK